ncbi:hypothetical protein FKM82_023403 [Ascaphus truei]
MWLHRSQQDTNLLIAKSVRAPKTLLSRNWHKKQNTPELKNRKSRDPRTCMTGTSYCFTVTYPLTQRLSTPVLKNPQQVRV